MHFEVDSEILNYEYEREVRHTSEDDFTSDDTVESKNDDESGEEQVLKLNNRTTNASDCEEEKWVTGNLCHLNQTSADESQVRSEQVSGGN